MVSLVESERILGERLLRLPSKHNYRYGPQAENDLLRLLFCSLVGYDDDRIPQLFQGASNLRSWKLAEAQGAQEGAEYTEAARGKRCGHIFRAGEATYRCVTCAADDTCVLCSRCFDSSDHTGHQYHISLSSGNCGCCDCGDDEAWRVPLFCAIHTDSGDVKGKERAQHPVPEDWVKHIRLTISRVLDYFCDVISCSPEQLRLVKSEETIRKDEVASRLRPGWYGEGDQEEEEPEFALTLWNDEKHTIRDVAHQVTRACRERDRFGEDRAHETNDIGRSVVKYSKDLQRLLAVSTIIEQIKVTVTVRSARDTFREQMCGTIVEWLSDIAGCSVLGDNNILRRTICEEFLGVWRPGSSAYNAGIGMKGIDDHQKDENAPIRTVLLTLPQQGRVMLATPGFMADDDDDDMDGPGPDDDDPEDGGDEDEDDDDVEDVADEYEEYVEALDDADDEGGEMETDLNRMSDEPDEQMDTAMTNTDEALDMAQTLLEGYSRQAGHPPQEESDQNQPQQAPSNEGPPDSGDHDSDSTSNIRIPRTPSRAMKPSPAKTPSHWLVRPTAPARGAEIPPCEDLWQRTRLDWMVLFDLRLWKKTRTDLRDLYIGTVVNVPEFKRIMGLRLSSLYTALAELYLIADREPDHSIVNLSLQLLTTPSITEEVVHRGNFLTNVMAILYTFLTTRQVSEPYRVNPNATLAFDAGSVANRRLYHFFLDLRYLLQSEYVQQRVRTEEQYIPQFLDLVKLSQGICPNVRAVREHVEYETDTWISASILMREINRLCRQFSEAFRNPEADGAHLFRAIKTATIAAVVHSTGIERKRFEQAEIKEYVRFKYLPCFDFECDQPGKTPQHRVVDFVVERGWISFHHALHYTLSWLLECGRNMSSTVMRDILLDAAKTANSEHIHDGGLGPEDLLLAMFDYPLRVCAWLAQMKAGMWVRNGLSLRHQMSQYRGVSSRDFAYYRDIFMLQTAMVTCDPSRVLASIADRFGVVDWMVRDSRLGHDDGKVLDVTEDFVHLLVILLTDRTSLNAIDDSESMMRENIRRDVAHVLCFKPLSFSDLSTRLSDKLLDSDLFQPVLDEIADFRPPEGLNDTGTFELKSDYIDLVDPYSAHYSKNQRDEAENVYRKWIAKKTGKKASDVVYEPKLRPITTGAFSELPRFSKTPLFAQIVHQCLDYVTVSDECTPNIPATRVETFLQVVLHLILAAALEDDTDEDAMADSASFVSNSLSKARNTRRAGNVTIVGLLEKISVMNEFSACGPKIRHILKTFWHKRPDSYKSATASLQFPFDRVDTNSPAIDADNEKEIKKKQALERQARVMAQFQQQQQNFLSNQGDFDWGEEDLSSDAEPEPEPAPEAKVWKYPTGTCILCQEETNDSRLYGTFALLQDTSMLRETDVRDPDWIREVLKTPSNLDKSAEDIRPFGVAGENRTWVKRLDSTGGEVISEKTGLSKGFNAKNTHRGPVSTSCGHIMHYSCFEVYYAATQNRHSHQVARNHPERLPFKEFVCPLCKALGNAFLPITWRGIKESHPGPLNTSVPFTQFINSEIKFAFLQPYNYALIVGNDNAMWRPYTEHFTKYLSKAMAQPLSDQIDELKGSTLASTAHYAPQVRMQMPGVFPSADDANTVDPQQVPLSDDSPMFELLQIYKRLKKTIRVNHIHSTFNHSPETMNTDELIHTDSLIRSFGFGIASVEIAQRGVASEPGATLLDKIPQLTLTHLRVLAETALTYAAVGILYNANATKNRPVKEFREMHRQKMCQLFVGHPCIQGTSLVEEVYTVEPLLGLDTFIFLAECSLSLVPLVDIDIRHLIQMCYVAEIVKVTTTFILYPHGLKEELAQHGDAHSLIGEELSNEQYGSTRHFFDAIVSELKNNSIGRAGGSSFPTGIGIMNEGFMKEGEGSAAPGFILGLRRMISSYALTFLRKAVILLYVRYGVEFPASFADVEASELDRLTKELRLPPLDEILASVNPARQTGEAFDSIVSGWIFHWNASRLNVQNEERKPWPSLPHPAIFELIGLPKYFDSLIEEANRRRCPNSKKELSDPSICLFCGEIFCSQAVCCMEGKLGGCNQHVQK